MPELLTTVFFLIFLKDAEGFSGGMGTVAGSAVFNAMIIPAFSVLAVYYYGISKTIKISKNVMGFRNYTKKFFPNIPIFVPTSYGGCFAVNRNAIHKYSKDFYFQLLNSVNHHTHPIEAHYLERLWCYMFSKKRFLKRACFDVLKTKLERLIN